MKAKILRRGDIFWVDFDPTKGSEIQKSRPALVVSNDSANMHSKVVTVLPFTTNVSKIYPDEVFVKQLDEPGLEADSKILANQIRTIDKSRIKNFIGSLAPEILEKVEKAIKIHLSLDEFNTD